jgi:TRAP-type C4-dicarboxylate transport system substrate-binding protein
MKRASILFTSVSAVTLAGVLLASLVGCGGSQGDPNAQAVELHYSIFFPPSHVQCKTAEAWAREVENRREGEDHDARRRDALQGAADLPGGG